MACGTAKTLLEALERVEAGGGGRPQVNRLINLGIAGVMPQNWVGTQDKMRTTCDGREVGQSEPHPGGLSLRRGRGQSLTIQTPMPNNVSHNPPVGRAGAEPLLLHPPSPHPLKITPRWRGAMMALSDALGLCLIVSSPMANSPAHPIILLETHCPLTMMTSSPQLYHFLHYAVAVA